MKKASPALSNRFAPEVQSSRSRSRKRKPSARLASMRGARSNGSCRARVMVIMRSGSRRGLFGPDLELALLLAGGLDLGRQRRFQAALLGRLPEIREPAVKGRRFLWRGRRALVEEDAALITARDTRLVAHRDADLVLAGRQQHEAVEGSVRAPAHRAPRSTAGGVLDLDSGDVREIDLRKLVDHERRLRQRPVAAAGSRRDQGVDIGLRLFIAP